MKPTGNFVTAAGLRLAPGDAAPDVRGAAFGSPPAGQRVQRRRHRNQLRSQGIHRSVTSQSSY